MIGLGANKILMPKSGGAAEEVFDVNKHSLVLEKYIYNPSEADGRSIFINQDGTIMVTASKHDIYCWNLNTAFDITSRTLHSSAALPYTTIVNICMSPDGLHLYTGCIDSMNYYRVMEDRLDAPFDVSGVSDWSYSSSISGKRYFMLSPDGTKIYTYKNESPYEINQYSLPNPYFLSNHSLDKSEGVGNDRRGLTMSIDGLKFYHAYGAGLLFQHDLSIEKDIGTEVQVGYISMPGSFYGIHVSESARKVYTAHSSSSSSRINQYTY